MADFNLADELQALNDDPPVPNEIDISSLDAGEINATLNRALAFPHFLDLLPNPFIHRCGGHHRRFLRCHYRWCHL